MNCYMYASCFLDIFRAVYELLWQAVSGGVKKESFFSTIGDVLVCL